MDRLRSYLLVSGGDFRSAIDLYDWGSQIGAAFHEDLGRLEVVFRNAVDTTLVAHGRAWCCEGRNPGRLPKQ